LEFVALRQEVIAVGIAAWLEVQIAVIAQDGGPDHGVFLVAVVKGFEPGDDIGIDDGVLFDPADLALGGFDFEESTAVVEDLEPVAILDGRYAVGDGGHAVPEEGLLEEDIDDFGLLLAMEAAATAAGQEHQQREDAREGAEGRVPGSERRRGMAVSRRNHGADCLRIALPGDP